MSSQSISAAKSWDLDGLEDYVIFTARWTNATSNAALVVRLPDGRKLTEDEFEAQGLFIVPELTGETQRSVGILSPPSGTWEIELIESGQFEGLVYEAIGAAEPVAFRFQDPAFTMAADTVTIMFVADETGSASEISFYYDEDPDTLNGLFIGSVSAASGPGKITWDTRDVAPGIYAVYAVVTSEGATPVTIVANDRLSLGESADLSVSATADPQELTGPGRILYRVTVRNSSDMAAEGVQLRVGIPEGLVVADATLAEARQDGSTLIFELGTLGAGNTADIAVETTLLRVDEAQRFVVDAYVFAKTYDPDPDNDLAFAATRVTP